MKISHWNTAANLTRGAPIRCNCAPCWIENRRHRRASSGHRKDTSHKRNQDPFTARQVFELVGILLCPRIASWQVGLWGTQADEAAMPGPNATAQAHRNWNSLKFSRVFSLYPGKSVCWELESARRLCQDLLSQHKRSQKLQILLSRRPEVVGEHVYAKSTVMYRSACCNALRADPESKCTVK